MKSKLKQVQPKVTVEDIENDLYHCCRWCHYYQNGRCFNSNVMENYAESTIHVYQVAEDGRLDGTLEEIFHSVSKSSFTKAISILLSQNHISDKKTKEIIQILENIIDKWFDDEVKYKLEGAISKLYQDDAEESYKVEGVEISDPNSHYCGEFM